MAVEKSPIAWGITPLKRYAEFSGRSSRAELWWFMLFSLVSGAEPSAGMLGAFGVAGILIVLLWLALLVPTIAVQARRLHDTNRSGWWLGAFYILYAIYIALLFGSLGSAMGAAMEGATEPAPASGAMFAGVGLLAIALFVYMIVLLVFYVLPGTPGPNNYGPDPYGAHDNLEGVFS